METGGGHKDSKRLQIEGIRAKASCKVYVEEMKQKDLLTAELEEKLLCYRSKICLN